MEETNKDYGIVTWNIEDVLSEADALNLNITQKEAVELLEENEDHIKEAMVSAGWIVIQNALSDKKKLRQRESKDDIK